MPLWIPGEPNFQFRASGHLTTRPGTTFGNSLSASSTPNAYGSLGEVISPGTLSEDCYGISIVVSQGYTNATDRSGTITISKDDTGGASWEDWLTDLIVGSASDHSTAADGPTYYYFPMYIKAGSSIAAKYASNVGSSTCRIAVTAFGRPKYPQAVRCATKFQSFGASAGNGTSITSGTTSEGSWTQVGSNPSFPLWWWQFGMQCTDTTMANIMFHVDLAHGDASNKSVIFEDAPVWFTSSERIVKPCFPAPSFYVGEVTPSDLIYMRTQCSGTPDTGLEVAAYGVG